MKRLTAFAAIFVLASSLLANSAHALAGSDTTAHGLAAFDHSIVVSLHHPVAAIAVGSDRAGSRAGGCSIAGGVIGGAIGGWCGVLAVLLLGFSRRRR